MVPDQPSMRQKWFDVVAAISLAPCERAACMFIAAPRPVGFAARATGREHETGLPPWFACDRQRRPRVSWWDRCEQGIRLPATASL